MSVTEANRQDSTPSGGTQPQVKARVTPLASSTGTKILIAVSGLALFAYLLIHLAGNALVFAGPRTFNGYSHLLISSPLIIVLEVALAALFLFHIWKTVRNYLANRGARPDRYVVKKMAGPPSRKSAASSTMIITGTLLLLFVVIHLKQFRFGTEYHELANPAVRDLYRTEMEVLTNPINAIFYSLAMLAVGFHVWHGFWSAWQSLGIGNKRLTDRLAVLAKAFAVLITGGFIFIIFWVLLYAGPAYLKAAP